MPVKLRLRRQGRRKSPHYAIVAADARAPRDGKYIEKIGFLNTLTSPARVYINHDAAIKWLQVGAQPTSTVRDLLRHTGVTVKFALIKQGKTEEERERIYGKWRSDKDGKSKKKFVSVDIHDRALEPVPGQKETVVETREALPKKEEAAPVVEEAAPVVEEAVEEAVETATEAVEEAAEAATEVVEEAAETVTEAAEEVAETATEAVEEVAEAVEEATDTEKKEGEA